MIFKSNNKQPSEVTASVFVRELLDFCDILFVRMSWYRFQGHSQHLPNNNSSCFGGNLNLANITSITSPHSSLPNAAMNYSLFYRNRNGTLAYNLSKHLSTIHNNCLHKSNQNDNFVSLPMKNFALYILLFFWCCPFLYSTDQLWIPEPLASLVNSIDYESQHLYTEFETTVPVSIVCDYPCLKGTTSLSDHVNEKLEMAARKRFQYFIEQEKNAQGDLNQDFGGCDLSYVFYPLYYSKNLISVLGCESQHRACPHGWTHYEGRNFWQRSDSIIEITLVDLFIQGSEWCSYLLQYCDHYFKSLNYGYYGQLSEFTTELKPEHLNTFLITDQGIIIVFPSYVMSGWADGPDTISIPYRVIEPFIDPTGPLKDLPGINRK